MVIKWLEARQEVQMIHFSTTLKAPICILWILLLTTPHISATKIQGKFPNFDLADFVRRFISPYITSLRIVKEPEFKADSRKTTLINIEELIKTKVDQFKNDSLLQDNEYGLEEDDEKLMLEGEDETTIMEIEPEPEKRSRDAGEIKNVSESFKNDIQKYKKMRNRIKKSLKRENVTEKTRSLVTTALDALIARIIGHQCTWNDNASRTLLRNDGNMKTDPVQLAKSWSTVWKQLKAEYYKTENQEPINEEFFEKFQKLITNMIKDMHLVSQYYKTVCSLVNLNSTDNNQNNRYNTISRTDAEKMRAQNTLNGLRTNDDCIHFKICSEELKGFMLDFYNNLNETAVSTLRNYAAMFIRDVTQEGQAEKNLVITQVNKTAEAVEARVNKTFQKQLLIFTLDKQKDEQANRKILQDFVNTTIERVKRSVGKLTKKNLKILNAKLEDTVTDDINVNLDMDLGNLQREQIGRICTIFEICNSNYVLGKRRSDKPGGYQKKLFVKVQLTLDQHIKDILTKDLLVINRKSREISTTISPQLPALQNVTRTTFSAPRNRSRIRRISKHPHMKL